MTDKIGDLILKYRPNSEILTYEGMLFEKQKGGDYYANWYVLAGFPALQPFNPLVENSDWPLIYQSSFNDSNFPANCYMQYYLINIPVSIEDYLLTLNSNKRRKARRAFEETDKLSLKVLKGIDKKMLHDYLYGKNPDPEFYGQHFMMEAVDILEGGFTLGLYDSEKLLGYNFMVSSGRTLYYLGAIMLDENITGNMVVASHIKYAIENVYRYYDMENIPLISEPRTAYKHSYFNKEVWLPTYTKNIDRSKYSWLKEKI